MAIAIGPHCSCKESDGLGCWCGCHLPPESRRAHERALALMERRRAALGLEPEIGSPSLLQEIEDYFCIESAGRYQHIALLLHLMTDGLMY